MAELAGRALVTGAGKRLGRAMAEALAADGWHVAVHYNVSAGAAEAVVSGIIEDGGRAHAIAADLSTEADMARLIPDAADALGGAPSLLVNSASTFADDRAQTHSREDWDHHMQANLRAPVRLSQAFAAALPAESRGLIVNMIDQRVRKLNPQFFTYTLSKSALWTATRTLAQALSPQVRVNAIAPGPTLPSIHQSQAEFDAETAATLTGRGADPEEIVRALRYLIAAHSVTGQMIACDGGQHLLWQTPDITGA